MPPKGKKGAKKATEGNPQSRTLQDRNADSQPASERFDLFLPHFVSSISLSYRDPANSTMVPGSHPQSAIITDNEPPSSVLKVQPGVTTRMGQKRLHPVVEEEEHVAVTPDGARRNLNPHFAGGFFSPSLAQELLVQDLDKTAEKLTTGAARLSFGGANSFILPDTSTLDSTTYEASDFEHNAQENSGGNNKPAASDQQPPPAGGEPVDIEDIGEDPDADNDDVQSERDTLSPEPSKEPHFDFTKLVLQKVLALVNDGQTPGTFEFAFLYTQNMSDGCFADIFNDDFSRDVRDHIIYNAEFLTQTWVSDFLRRDSLPTSGTGNFFPRNLTGLKSLGRLMYRMMEKQYPWFQAMSDINLETPEGEFPKVLEYFKRQLDEMCETMDTNEDIPGGVFYGWPLVHSDAFQRNLSSLRGGAEHNYELHPANILGYILEYLGTADNRIKRDDSAKAQIAICTRAIQDSVRTLEIAVDINVTQQGPEVDRITDDQYQRALAEIDANRKHLIEIIKVMRDQWSRINSLTCKLFNLGEVRAMFWDQFCRIPELPDNTVMVYVPRESPVGASAVLDENGETVIADHSMLAFNNMVTNLKNTWKHIRDRKLSTQPFRPRQRGASTGFTLPSVPPPATSESRQSPGLRANGKATRWGPAPATELLSPPPSQPSAPSQPYPDGPPPGPSARQPPLVPQPYTLPGPPPGRPHTAPQPHLSRPPPAPPGSPAHRQPPGLHTSGPPPGASAFRQGNIQQERVIDGATGFLNRNEDNRGGPNNSGSSRYRSNDENLRDQFVFTRAESLLQTAKSHLDTETSTGLLDTTRKLLQSCSTNLENMACSGIALPTILFDNLDLCISRHLIRMTGLLADKCEIIRLEAKHREERKKQSLAQYRNNIKDIKLPTLTGQNNWLLWRHSLQTFLDTVRPEDNDQGVFFTIYGSLSAENQKNISVVNPSIERLQHRFEVKYQKNVVQRMVDVNIAVLPVPKGTNAEYQMSVNTREINENILLVYNYGRIGEFTLDLISKMERVSFNTFYMEKWKDHIANQESKLNVATTGDFSDLDRTVADATNFGQSLLDRMNSTGTASPPGASPNRAFSTLSAYQRLMEYIGFVGKLQVILDGNAAEDGAAPITKPSGTSGASAHVNINEATVMFNNSNNSNKTSIPKKKTTGKPAFKQPQIPCPARSLGCDHTVAHGSVFNCENFRMLSKTERAACVKNDNLCGLCLQQSHGVGTLCGYKQIKCSYCGLQGIHNRRSGLCSKEVTQPAGQMVQTNLNDVVEVTEVTEVSEDLMADMIADSVQAESMQTNMVNIVAASVEAEDYTPDIETDTEEFQDSLVRPNPYSSPDQPDVPLDQLPKIKEAMEFLRFSCTEAAKTGKSRVQLKQEEEAAAVIQELDTLNCALTMCSTQDIEPTDHDTVGAAIKDLVIDPHALRDRLYTKDTTFPHAIDHSSRGLSEIKHLQVTPQSTGASRGMFDTIHRTAVALYEKYPKAIMQQITVAILIENDNAFPGDISHMVDTRIIRENGQRFLIISGLLDSGCSLVMLDKEVLTNLQPARMTEFRQNIVTGNGLVKVDDFQYEICLRTSGGDAVVKTLAAPLTSTLGVQPGLTDIAQRLIHEELRIPEEVKHRFSLREKAERAYFLLGINANQCQPRMVSPLSLGCRPPLFSPNLRIFNVDVAYNNEDQCFVSGNIGMDKILYSSRFNTPAYFVQEENLEKGKLLPWQTFSPHLLQTVSEMQNRDNEQVYLAMANISRGSTAPPDPKGPPLRPILENSLRHISELDQMASNEIIRDESCMFLVKAVEEDVANINLIEAKEVEKFIESEAGIFVPLPVCSAHQKIWSSVVEKCPDCLKSADPDSERKKALALEIKKNIHIVPDPGNETKAEEDRTYTLVQKHVNGVSRDLCGHIAISNFNSAFKSSEKLVKNLSEKKDGKMGLASLAKQNRQYLEADKFRILSPEQLRQIADGEVSACWFHRNLVYKPDSVSTGVRYNTRWFIISFIDRVVLCRMIVDTARGIRGTPYTLANNNPSPKGMLLFVTLSETLIHLPSSGYTPNLSQTLTRFCWHKRYVALDISKACEYKSLPVLLYLMSTFLDHSIRLHRDDFLTFCSVWFAEVEKHGTKFPYACCSVMTDFGMGKAFIATFVTQPNCHHLVLPGHAHLSLAGGIQIAGTFCRLPGSLFALLRELFVDNIGLANIVLKELFATMTDIIQTLARWGFTVSSALTQFFLVLRFKLVIDKVYMPHSYLQDENCPPRLTVPATTIMFGVLWSLGDDTVLPRIKLHWHGFKRGKPIGGPLEETDVFAETLTRRVFSRLLASFFDLLGRYLGVAISQIKLRCKKLILATPGVHLDEDIRNIDPELDTELKTFWDSFKHIQTRLLPHPRSVIQLNQTLEYLTICHDASPRMLGSVVHAITSQNGEMFSAVLGSKSALHTGTGNTATHTWHPSHTMSSSVPRNEKLSAVQATDVLLAICSSLDMEWKDNQKVYILGDRFVSHSHLLATIVSLSSTIASYMFAGETYSGDGLSRATYIRITAALTVIGKIFPELTVCFAWIENQFNKCSDFLTKEFPASAIMDIMNGPDWREGASILRQPSILEKFKYFEWKGSSGSYSPLPDYLKKLSSHDHALLMHAACSIEDDCPLAMAMLWGDSVKTFSHPEKLPGPPDDDLLFYFFTKPHAVRMFINTATRATDQEANNVIYAALRSGRNTAEHRTDDSTFLPSSSSSPLVFSTATRGTWNTKTKKWSTGIKTVKESRNIKKVAISNIKVKTLPKPVSRVIQVQPGNKIQVPRLPADCYKLSSFLHSHQDQIIHLEPHPNVHEYLDSLNRSEMFHTVLNSEASYLKTALTMIGSNMKGRASLATVSAEQIWISAWVRIIKTDQHFFPPKNGNMHEQLGIIFNKFVMEDTGASRHIAPLNIPLLASNSPLLMKLLMSCHKTYLEINRAGQPGESEVSLHTVHSSTVRTLCILTTGFFAVTCDNLKACATRLLRSCAGCRRHKEQFYRTRMAPRYVKTQVHHGAWKRVSFDELGPCLASNQPGGRKTISCYFYIFSCIDSGAVCALATYKIGGNALQQAVQGLVWKTGATPEVLYCDGFSSHTNIDHVGTVKIEPNVSHAKHRNFVENRIKEFKKYLRAISNSQKVEPLHLGSLTVLDLQFIFDGIAYAINSTPISPESSLCPAQIIWPGTINSLMNEQLEDEVFSDLGSGKNAKLVDKLLRDYRDIIFTERSKHLLALQKDFEKGPRFHAVKKGKRSHVEAEVGDIVLLDYEDNKKLRMARILSLNEDKTTAEVLVKGKPKQQAVASLRVLSTFRRPPGQTESGGVDTDV